MAISLDLAFTNIDNVVANAAMTRKEHVILAESIQTIRKAAMPLQEVKPPKDDDPEIKKPEGPEAVNGNVREDLKEPEENETDE